MRERLPNKLVGDTLSASHINALNRVARNASNGQHPTFGHYRESTALPDPPWAQNTVQITQIVDRNKGLFQVKLRFYDHPNPSGEDKWLVYDESGEWFLDVSDWIDPNDSQNFIPRLFNLDVGDRITAYWHLQRGMWLPICCPVPPDVVGSDDTGVLEHCCVAVCDTVGGVEIPSEYANVLFDTILPATANVFFLNPFTGEITTNIEGTKTYNISYCVGVEEVGSTGLISAKLQRDGADDTWVDVPCPILQGRTAGAGPEFTLTSPVIVLDLVQSELIRVQVKDSTGATPLSVANGSYLSICLNDCVVEPLTIGSGSGV